MPFCGYGFLIGFAVACVLSYHGHPQTGVAFMLAFFFLGALGDIAQMIWRVYWRFTQTCGYCGQRVSPMTRARVLSDDLKNGKYWFCSPKCYLEFSRRFHATERKQINILSEGEPLIKFSKE